MSKPEGPTGLPRFKYNLTYTVITPLLLILFNLFYGGLGIGGLTCILTEYANFYLVSKFDAI